MKSLNLFFLTLLTINSIAFAGIIKKGQAWFRTKIVFAVDDRINNIYLNDNLVPVSFGLIGTNVWATVKEFDLVLFPGDELKFELENYEGIHDRDSYGFVASIFYIDQSGRKKTFVTNENWLCDGKKPQLLKLLRHETGLSKISWTYDRELNQDGSYIIWGESAKYATCTFTIPRL